MESLSVSRKVKIVSGCVRVLECAMGKGGSCRRAFVIGLDGAIGWAVREADTPCIDEVLRRGVVTYSAETVVPTSSFEAWGAMFHGVGPEKHRIDGSRPFPEDSPYPSFVKVVRQAWPWSRCASFSCWKPINDYIIERSCRCYCVSMPDPQLAKAAADYIRAQPPDLFFMQLDFIDAAGHSYGYGSRRYLEQISEADSLVGMVIDAIKEAGVLEESLVVLVSDHGGVGRTHGSTHPDCMTIFWGCRGPGIMEGCILEGCVNIMDTAAVVTHALGLQAPIGWDAKVPKGVFKV